MYCDGNHNIMQEADQKLKGPLSVRGSSSRRPLQVDLSKLETSSLKRYRQVYNLREVTSSCKEELIPAVAQHFAAQVWSMLHLKLFMLFTCGSKLVQIADFLFTIPLLIATISGCGGK
jgi:hypothetical protein